MGQGIDRVRDSLRDSGMDPDGSVGDRILDPESAVVLDGSGSESERQRLWDKVKSEVERVAPGVVAVVEKDEVMAGKLDQVESALVDMCRFNGKLEEKLCGDRGIGEILGEQGVDPVVKISKLYGYLEVMLHDYLESVAMVMSARDVAMDKLSLVVKEYGLRNMASQALEVPDALELLPSVDREQFTERPDLDEVKKSADADLVWCGIANEPEVNRKLYECLGLGNGGYVSESPVDVRIFQQEAYLHRLLEDLKLKYSRLGGEDDLLRPDGAGFVLEMLTAQAAMVRLRELELERKAVVLQVLEDYQVELQMKAQERTVTADVESHVDEIANARGGGFLVDVAALGARIARSLPGFGDAQMQADHLWGLVGQLGWTRIQYGAYGGHEQRRGEETGAKIRGSRMAYQDVKGRRAGE